MSRKTVSAITLALLISMFTFMSLNFNPLVHAQSGITRVQGTARGGGTEGPISVTLTSNPTVGNLLVLTYSSFDTSYDNITSITQTGVTWSKQIQNDAFLGTLNGTYVYGNVEIWAGAVNSGATTSISVAISNNPYIAIVDVCEYSGLSTSSFLDVTAASSGISDTVSPATGTTTLTNYPNELAIGLIGVANLYDVTQSNSTNGFSLLDGTDTTNGLLHFSTGYLEKIEANQENANSSVTIPSPAWYVSCIATFVRTRVTDVALTNVVSSKTAIGQGYDFNVTVEAANFGIYQETFNLTLYATTFILQQNVTLQIASQNITLESENDANITLVVNITSYPYGNYTVDAYASPVPNETNTANNDFTGGEVTVTIPGDLNGDFKVSLQDLVYLTLAYGTTPESGGIPGVVHAWNPNADIDNNGVVGQPDFVLLALHYGQHYP